MKTKVSVERLNSMACPEFVSVIGPVFEHSPWIAEASWPRRPFADLMHLHQALTLTVEQACEAAQLALIRAHPDLVGRAALERGLTRASAAEQTSAGLDRLSPEEISAFQQFNEAYRSKFGFPFVICARLNKKDAILQGFRERLVHDRARELRTALEEISKIAYLRLQDIVS